MFIPTSPEVYYVDTFGYADIDRFNFAKSHSFDIGFRYKYNACKWYGIGFNFEWGVTKFHHKKYGMWINSNYGRNVEAKVKYNKYVSHNFNLEFFQRFRLASVSLGDVYFDLGVFGGFTLPTRNKIFYKIEIEEWWLIDKRKETHWENTMHLNYGVKARLGYSFIALFAQYDFHTFDLIIIDSRAVKLGIEVSIPY